MGKQLKILRKILKFTNLDKALGTLIVLLITSSVIIWKVEDNVTTIFDGFWWAMTTVTTVGYGDIVITTVVGRIVGMILMAYGILLLTLITGTIVTFASEIMKEDRKKSLKDLKGKIDNIHNLSDDELTSLQKEIYSLFE